MITKHTLTSDFPEFTEQIHTLKIENAHFKKLFASYDEIDHKIYNSETNTEPTSDEILNQMRLERVKIKDEIYNFLKNN